MSIMLESKRATRGLRMDSLVGKAAEDDELFWNADTWEESDDDSFEETEPVKPDEFDSDFNDTEDEGEDDDDDDNDDKTIKRNEPKETSTTNRYIEPKKSFIVKKKIDRKRNIDCNNNNNNNKSLIIENTRIVRKSTMSKTIDGDKIRSQETTTKVRQQHRPQIKHQYTQKELLLECLETEVINQKWIESRKLEEIERVRPAKVEKKCSSYIRHHSKRGSYPTITFTDMDSMPIIFKNLSIPVIPNKKCVVTGLDAKYKDPKSNLPYANLEAYREIQKNPLKYLKQ